jgi:flagellar protein FliL
MADESKTTIENGAKDGAEAMPAKKGPNKIILFGGIGLGAVVIGLALALFVIKPMLSSAPSDAGDNSATDEHAKADVSEKQSEKHGKEAGKKDAHNKKSDDHGGDATGSLLHQIDNIVVNPAGTGGSRYLSVSIAFELDSKETIGLFENRSAIIRDALITILSSKSVSQLTDSREKEITRLQIKRRVESLLKTQEIAGVYYTDFVLQ